VCRYIVIMPQLSSPNPDSYEWTFCSFVWHFCILGMNLLIVYSLHDVHEVNIYRADHVCPSTHLSIWFNSRTTGQIWMKFGTDVMPLGTTLTISNTNMAY
jgi:hypothetical protein